MRLLNVRLGPEDDRLARELRARRVSISDLVRDAIRAEARRARAGAVPDVDAVLSEMLTSYPTPTGARTGAPAPGTDRHRVKEIIHEKLRRTR